MPCCLQRHAPKHDATCPPVISNHHLECGIALPSLGEPGRAAGSRRELPPRHMPRTRSPLDAATPLHCLCADCSFVFNFSSPLQRCRFQCLCVHQNWPLHPACVFPNHHLKIGAKQGYGRTVGGEPFPIPECSKCLLKCKHKGERESYNESQ